MFTIVALGTQGGIVEGDLTAYLVRADAASTWVQLDAGTVATGRARAIERGSLKATDRTVATLISHPHLDHTAGFILSSPEEKGRVYGLAPTIDALVDDVFNGTTWANMLDEGPQAIGRFHAVRLQPGIEAPLEGSGLVVTAFPLSHAGGVSTAFLVGTGESAVLYLGDTGPDDVEKSTRLALLWERVAPLVRGKRLAGIFLEASFANDREDTKLFGHLTPKWMMRELRRLAEAVDPKAPSKALAGLTIVVTHIKPSTTGTNARSVIMKELAAANDLGVKLAFPQQGDKLELTAPK